MFFLSHVLLFLIGQVELPNVQECGPSTSSGWTAQKLNSSTKADYI